MKILVIGSGGREHALVWKINQSTQVSKIYCAPGNAGISQLAQCINIGPDKIMELADFAQKTKIDLTVVGPTTALLPIIKKRLLMSKKGNFLWY
jgi:phosphoribosylamine--glycine ligase